MQEQNEGKDSNQDTPNVFFWGTIIGIVIGCLIALALAYCKKYGWLFWYDWGGLFRSFM